MADAHPDIVSAAWLADHLDIPTVRVVDASWYLPAMKRDALAEYEERHIPGAVFFDIDDVSDDTSPYPHMLPTPEKFSSRVRRLGLGTPHHIVVYDGAGLFSAARVWWMFKAMGHDQVSVLDGGLPKWIAEERPTESGIPFPTSAHFTAHPNQSLIRSLEEMRDNLSEGAEQVVDARPAGRFTGQQPEPRPGLPSGHMPGSVSVPMDTLLNGDGTLKPPSDLKQIFTKAGLNLSKPVVTSCGSGVTAAVLFLGLTLLGHKHLALYDGSWSEWAAQPNAPIDTI